MKKELRNTAFALQGFPQTIVSVRDKKGKNNALAVGYVTNVNINPAMMLIGIAPSRYSHHMIKENPWSVFFIKLYAISSISSEPKESRIETAP